MARHNTSRKEVRMTIRMRIRIRMTMRISGVPWPFFMAGPTTPHH